MSRDERLGVQLSLSPDLRALLADMEAAHRRAEKSEPGERADIVRYESLCASLEALAAVELSRDPAALTAVPDDGGLTAGVFARFSPESVTVPLTLPLE